MAKMKRFLHQILAMLQDNVPEVQIIDFIVDKMGISKAKARVQLNAAKKFR